MLVPELNHDLLGNAAWRIFEIGIDGENETWWLRGVNGRFAMNASAILETVSLLSGPILSLKQEGELCSLLNRMLPLLQGRGTFTTMIKHRIQVETDVLIRQRNYPVLPVVKKQMQGQTKQLLMDGIIERSDTLWVNPVMVR